MNKISTKIYIRTERKKTSGEYPLYFRIILRRQKREYSLHICLPLQHWNASKHEVRSIPNKDKINELIKNYLVKVETLVIDSNMKGENLDLSDFDQIFKGTPEAPGNFYSFVESELNLSANKLSAGSVKVYNTEMDKLRKYSPNLQFKHISVLFLKGYEKNLAEVEKNKPITIHKSMRWIKSIINRAISVDLVTENPFKKYKIGKAPAGNMEFLTLDEVRKLEKLFTGNMDPHDKEILRYFLFSCFTGLRYQDLKALNFSNIIKNGENYYLYIHMQKTKDVINIPLVNRSLKLIGGLKDIGKVFKVYSDQETNRRLKFIMPMVGITKSISIHCARHTFATVAAQIGFSAMDIQKLCGHSDLRTTSIYMKVSNDALQEKMKLFDSF